MGLVFAAFSWTYAVSQIPGGILLDRIGVRLTYSCPSRCGRSARRYRDCPRVLASLFSARLALGITQRRPPSPATVESSAPGFHNTSEHAPRVCTLSANTLALPFSARFCSGSAPRGAGVRCFSLWASPVFCCAHLDYRLSRSPHELGGSTRRSWITLPPAAGCGASHGDAFFSGAASAS